MADHHMVKISPGWFANCEFWIIERISLTKQPIPQYDVRELKHYQVLPNTTLEKLCWRLCIKRLF